MSDRTLELLLEEFPLWGRDQELTEQTFRQALKNALERSVAERAANHLRQSRIEAEFSGPINQ